MRTFTTTLARINAVVLISLLCLAPAFAQKDKDKDKETPAQESAPDVPDAIAVPEGAQPVLFVRASGSQVYTCKAGADGKYAWTLKGPEAELKDRKDKVIGEHSTGPTWKLKDGSEVTAKAVAQVESLDEDSVPWLRLEVMNNAKKGALTNVTMIQRVHTHGGKPGNDPCDESHKDSETKSKYTADYYFFAPAK